MNTAVVWLKRDLRTRDHAALHAARDFPCSVALYIVEPAWLDSPEFAPQHLAFVLGSLQALRRQGLAVHVRVGSAMSVLTELRRSLGFSHLFSHEETGPGWTYARDRAVARWCRQEGVQWQEFPQCGVVRPLRRRDGWAARWATRMAAPTLAPVTHLAGPVGWSPGELPSLPELMRQARSTSAPLDKTVPVGGEAAAWEVLDSFLDHRGQDYRGKLSSPLSAPDSCSRLSAHLAFGALSMRQVHQATEQRISALRGGDPSERAFAHALRGFSGRLRWHCHFMQKLEDEPAIEFRNFARACDGLRPGDVEGGGPALDDQAQARLHAWCEGRTGYPMVDACMRYLRATGWLNFRMRAMLVSFAAYHLWLHWREPGLFLARQFLDFEPGIHWSQMQMQSGTTGINTLRIYSPAKQQRDHDPDGAFVRRWVPEWCSDAYPQPILDERVALAHAKDVLYGLRGQSAARQEAATIQQRHGSRRSGLPPSGDAARPKAGGGARVARAARRASAAEGPVLESPQQELFP